jgi:hypothetical protein
MNMLGLSSSVRIAHIACYRKFLLHYAQVLCQSKHCRADHAYLTHLMLQRLPSHLNGLKLDHRQVEASYIFYVWHRLVPWCENIHSRDYVWLLLVACTNLYTHGRLKIVWKTGTAVRLGIFLMMRRTLFHYIPSIWYDTDCIGNTAYSSYSVACLFSATGTYTEPLRTHRQQGDLISLLIYIFFSK